ncbi:MAG TPA: hypothetical protein VNY36_01340, partial [Bacteroidia bacterium]|nr:hypothetical protein [Bacteroidia bacterium]
MRHFYPILRFAFVCVFAFIFNPTHAQVILTVAGSGEGDGSPATSASLNFPFSVAVDGSGNIYVADHNNNRVRMINTSGIISTIAGTGHTGYFGDGGQATVAELNGPSGLALDASGNLYISDGGNNCIRKVNTSGIISTYAGNGNYGYKGDGGLANLAELYNPEGLAIDNSGNLYIADVYNYRVRMVNKSTGIISTIAGDGNATYNGDGINSTSAELNVPTGLAIDGAGNIYIADQGNNRIRMINTSGIISTIAGNGSYGYTGDGIQATTSELFNPDGVMVDGSGNVYIA